MERLVALTLLAGCSAFNPEFDEAGGGGSGGTPTDATTDVRTTGAASSDTGVDATSHGSADGTGSTDDDPGSGSGAASEDTGVSACDRQTCAGVCLEDGCTAVRRVFVSSMPTTGNMGGIEGADGLCTELAASAGLPGTFAAWVSAAKDSPADRFTQSSLPYVKLDDTIVALDWDDLVDGTLLSPIDITEHGEPAVLDTVCTFGEVWTNTNPDGTARGFEDCQNWTFADPKGTSEVGLLTETTVDWTATATCGNVTCATALPVYCFEQ